LISLELNNSDFDGIYERNLDTVYRVCYIYMKNKTDAEDMTQNTFIKFLKNRPVFENLEHEKAWFIVTATNNCKNYFKTWWHRNTNITDEVDTSATDSSDEVIDAVLSLPIKYKQVIYMYYYEGYNSKDISKLLNVKESTVRTHLSKGREILKQKLGSEEV